MIQKGTRIARKLGFNEKHQKEIEVLGGCLKNRKPS